MTPNVKPGRLLPLGHSECPRDAKTNQIKAMANTIIEARTQG